MISNTLDRQQQTNSFTEKKTRNRNWQYSLHSSKKSFFKS